MARPLLRRSSVASAVDKQPLPESLGGRHRTHVERPRGGNKVIRFVKRLAHDLVADNIDNVGAMMAYYAILALFPMVVFIITLAMLVIDAGTVQQGLAMVESAMPAAASAVIADQVSSLIEGADARFALGTLAIALWGASRGAVALSGALNTMHNKTETRPWWRRQLIAIAVTTAVAVLVIVALALLVVGPIAGHWVADRLGLGGAFDVAWGVARWIGAGLLVMLVWAVVYKFLPDTDAPFRVFTPGAVVGVTLWLLISRAFGIYLENFGRFEATYGALGGAIVFLIWLWLSNIALLFGAEVNDVLAQFRKDESAAAARLADPHEKAQPSTT